MTDNAALARIQNLQNQIAVMRLAGKVDAKRVRYCTFDKFTDSEIEATLAMMTALGLV